MGRGADPHRSWPGKLTIKPSSCLERAPTRRVLATASLCSSLIFVRKGILWLLPEEDYSYDWVYRFESKGRDDGVNAVAQIKDSYLLPGIAQTKRCDPLLFGQIEALGRRRDLECHVQSSKRGSRRF